MTFYNTIHLKGAELLEALKGCTKQEEKVFLLLSNHSKPMAASDVLKVYNNFFNDAPITSIRRALNVLSNDPETKVINTNVQKIGPWGKPEYLYKIRV